MTEFIRVLFRSTQGNTLAALRTRRGSEEVADQLKLAHGRQRRLALVSLYFSFTQARSQFIEHTVDELVASVEPKTLASSIPSLITTR